MATKTAERRVLDSKPNGKTSTPERVEERERSNDLNVISPTEVVAGAVIGAAAGFLTGVAGGSRATTTTMAVVGGLVGVAAAEYCFGVRKKFSINRADFARMANVSERTLRIWEKTGPKRERDLRQLHELNRLHDSLSQILGDAPIGAWFLTPNPAFDGFKPIELLDRGQVDRLWRMVFELAENTAY